MHWQHAACLHADCLMKVQAVVQPRALGTAICHPWHHVLMRELSAAGQFPSLKDWETHLTTIFPEVRLKRYMEMRGADGGPRNAICALPALWVGLLYDRSASPTSSFRCLCEGCNYAQVLTNRSIHLGGTFKRMRSPGARLK